MSNDPRKSDDSFPEGEATILSPTASLRTEAFPSGLTPRELAHVLQGESLDQFQLQEFIGGGGMGVVFKALDTTLERIVAIKVVTSQSISSTDLERRFLVEAQSTARLDHPNIARIHFVGRDRGLSYIVFEYIEGENLRDIVTHTGPLPLGDALSYTYQMAHALTHAWQREVVHRDIKPSNILITRQGQAKLVDMGLARFYQVGATEEELTNTGVTLGTFDYISPEQARDPRFADARSDIYSLGCTLFFLLAGRPPFAQGTPAQKLLQHQSDQPPKLSQIRTDVVESVDNLVQRMLAKNPDDRPATPTDLVRELADMMRAIGIQPPHTMAPLPTSVNPRKKTSWKHVVPWATPLAVLVAWCVWFGATSQKPADDFSLPELRQPEEQIPTVEIVPSLSGSSTTQSWQQPSDDRPISASSDVGKMDPPSIDISSLLPEIVIQEESENSQEKFGDAIDFVSPLGEELLSPSTDPTPDE